MTRVRTSTPIHLLTETVAISRATTTKGAAGGSSQSWASVATGVSAAVQPQSGNEPVYAGRANPSTFYVVFVPGGTDVLQSDRIVWGSKTLKVDSVKDNQAAGVLIRLDCREVNP